MDAALDDASSVAMGTAMTAAVAERAQARRSMARGVDVQLSMRGG